MFDSKRELLDKIRLGEDSYLELKEVRLAGLRVREPRRGSLADEIAAFASLLARIPVPDHSWLTTDRATLMDRRGDGVRVILDNSERLSGKTPTYRMIGDAELLLTIHAAGVDR